MSKVYFGLQPVDNLIFPVRVGEILSQLQLVDVLQVGLLIGATGFGLGQNGLVQVGGQYSVAALGVDFIQNHGDGIRLSANGAAGAPDFDTGGAFGH